MLCNSISLFIVKINVIVKYKQYKLSIIPINNVKVPKVFILYLIIFSIVYNYVIHFKKLYFYYIIYDFHISFSIIFIVIN